MATRFLLPAHAPVQAGLRPYIVYRRLPEACFAFELRDHSCEPLLHRGECLVIDLLDREPVEGELFLVEWSGGRREVVEFLPRDVAGEPHWYLHSYNRPRSVDEVGEWLKRRWAGAFPDGPYAADAPPETHIRRRVVGKVIGILEMDFRPMLRIGQPVAGGAE